MRKPLPSLVLVVILLLASASIAGEPNSYEPRKGYVPDVQTAIAIAVAVWIPIYGKEQIENEKPYKSISKKWDLDSDGLFAQRIQGWHRRSENISR